MTTAIAGASGQLGRLVVQGLKERISPGDIVALARTPTKASDLGVAVREADYARPDSLSSGLKGVDTLLLISSSEFGQRAAHHRNVVGAAKAVGVERIVYTSLLHADRSPLNLAAEHLETEQVLKASGLIWTILRNGWYTENYTASISGALAGGAFVGSAGAGRISSASRRDYAEAAIAVLTSAGHYARTYELASDAAYTLTELAAEVSRQTGRTIPYRDLPESEYARMLQKFGLSVALAQAIASWDVCASGGALFDDTGQLARLIGRPTTPLAATVAAALK